MQPKAGIDMCYLDLGAGYTFRQHYATKEFNTTDEVRLDLYGEPDVRHDITKTPYPFADNTFNGILLSHVWEHFDIPTGIKILEECHRITKPGGSLVVYCPHFSSVVAKTHLTHARLVGWNTFDYVCSNTCCEEKYTRLDFVLKHRQLFFGKFWTRLKVLNWLANSHPWAYENHFVKLLPCPSELRVELEVVK